MAPRVLAISDVRVANLPHTTNLDAPFCSFELGMARVTTNTVRSSGAPDTAFGKQAVLYVAFDPHAQGAAHLRIHLYGHQHLRHDTLLGVGSVSLVAAVQAGAVSVHLLDPYGQDAADVEFAVHSLAPNEAANGVAVSHGPAVPVPAADNTSAAVLPGAEVTSAHSGQPQQLAPPLPRQSSQGGPSLHMPPGPAVPMQTGEDNPATPPSQGHVLHYPSTSSGTPRSDNGDLSGVPQVTGNRVVNHRTQAVHESGVFQNGQRVPTFRDRFGDSNNFQQSGSEEPWARSMTERARAAARGAMSNVRSQLDNARLSTPRAGSTSQGSALPPPSQ